MEAQRGGVTHAGSPSLEVAGPGLIPRYAWPWDRPRAATLRVSSPGHSAGLSDGTDGAFQAQAGLSYVGGCDPCLSSCFLCPTLRCWLLGRGSESDDRGTVSCKRAYPWALHQDRNILAGGGLKKKLSSSPPQHGRPSNIEANNVSSSNIEHAQPQHEGLR